MAATTSTRMLRSSAHRPRRRSRRGSTLKRFFSRLISSMTLGFLLVGCAGTPRVSMSQFGGLQAKCLDPDPVNRLLVYHQMNEKTVLPEVRPQAVELLVNAAATDRNQLARASAVSSLATFNEPVVKTSLLAAVRDQSAMVRQEAAKGLAAYADDVEVVNALGTMATRDADVDVRRHAVLGLAMAGQAEARNKAAVSLAKCVKDPDFTVAQSASQQLEKRTGRNFGRNYQEWAAFLDIKPEPPLTPSTGPLPPSRLVPVAN
jgi:hypothetical protein